MKTIDLAIIGGGPAGLAAAVAARESGIENILILERDNKLGGILGQCIHNGFGLHRFGEELTGPEYAERYIEKVKELGIEYRLSTMVTAITREKVITATNMTEGVFSFKAKAVVLAMGCRERSRGALNTAGTRPAGVYTAGAAQKFVNIMGLLPGKNAVILGSGDIGLIMARRMTLEGAKVLGVFEIMPYSGGLKRNIVQCLNDFNIPLHLSRTIVKIHGEARVEGVTVASVDENRNPVEGSFEYIPCDTVLLSVGLIPENELTKQMRISLARGTSGAEVNEDRQTEIPGVFSCGNVLHVHDLVDFVSEEAEIAGKAAAKYIEGGEKKSGEVKRVLCGEGVSYVVPQKLTAESGEVKLMFRVRGEMSNVRIEVLCGEECVLQKRKVKVAPGEMENLTLKAELLKGDITVRVSGGK